MGKSKKKKQQQVAHDSNPLLIEQRKFITSLPKQARSHFFSPTHITPEQRAEIWEDQADLGEKLVDDFAWATPDSRLLPVFKHFGPIVEVGCGANAYWAKWMHNEGGVDVVAFDVSLNEGGKISASKKSNKSDSSSKTRNKKKGLEIREGGPEKLSEDAEMKDRTLFLCYPDEDIMPAKTDESEEEDNRPLSMAAACLEHYSGDTIIYVGELFCDTLSVDQAPWGRSSANEFQERLGCEYHCILKMKLENNWLHVRDSLSVWKRSETCCMVFQGSDEEDEGDEEVEYKYIPPDEILPVDAAAPCVAHLLKKNGDDVKSREHGTVNKERKRKRDDAVTQHSQIAGNAW
ncbi:hypothetical protein ACHAWT_008063 [Skeletonema menzelii]